MQIEKKAEIKLLADLVKNPGRVFDVAAILRDGDFQHVSTRCIYSTIKRIAEQDASLTKERSIDQHILEQRLSTLFSEIYSQQDSAFSEIIDEVYSLNALRLKDFKTAVNFVLKNSITKRAATLLEKTKRELPQQSTYNDVLAHLETNIFDFTANAIDGSDIVILGENYKEALARRERDAAEGNLTVAIDTGFPILNKALGGGYRNGTVNMFAARSKMGKSWFSLKIADNVVKQGIPVLYMDTELDNNYQSDRRCAQHTKVPIHQLEKSLWTNSERSKLSIDEFFNYQKKYPIHYVDIKGWSIDRQISIIRKFFAKYVGKKPDGTYNQGLVILDYLKLMRAGEKGADKEWEALGYRMTLLHDLMGEYNNPMMALAQQNRDGLDRDDESTVSGSDRIIWLCDNFSIIGEIPEAELILQQEEVDQMSGEQKNQLIANAKVKVVVCRHGPGTPGGYITYYFDIKDRKLGHDEVCGHIEERGKRVSIATGAKGGALSS